jgi:hypothetical protein
MYTLPENVSRQAAQLRYDAQLCFRDGRTKQARKLNAKADNLESEARVFTGGSVTIASAAL